MYQLLTQTSYCYHKLLLQMMNKDINNYNRIVIQ